ncbi:MAG: hypothetical protein KAU28_10080 [Phycisphaerae bacterium]|nr:hypothetical protein [Phycisphaerae bacterium]
MSGTFWPKAGSKRLDFSGAGGGRKIEFLLGGALAVIIIGSLLLIIWPMVTGGPWPSKDRTYRFECQKCLHQFEMSMEDLDRREAEPSMAPMGVYMLDCPKCGGKNSALVMSKCPNCQKWYVLSRDKSPMQERPEDIGNVCPHCKTDVDEWRYQRRKKNR